MTSSQPLQVHAAAQQMSETAFADHLRTLGLLSGASHAAMLDRYD